MRKLRPFPAEKGSDLLAYEHVLLNPFDRQGILSDKGTSKVPYALNPELEENARSAWYAYLRGEYGGLPGFFRTTKCYSMVPVAKVSGFLKEADDEAKLTEWEEDELARLQAEGGAP
jgi:hypothetical protein